jgi:DNA repair protein RadC
LQYANDANASGIIICHNHPGGYAKPRESDLTITRNIKESGSLMDINLLDHLILVPEGVYQSIADEGML